MFSLLPSYMFYLYFGFNIFFSTSIGHWWCIRLEIGCRIHFRFVCLTTPGSMTHSFRIASRLFAGLSIFLMDIKLLYWMIRATIWMGCKMLSCTMIPIQMYHFLYTYSLEIQFVQFCEIKNVLSFKPKTSNKKKHCTNCKNNGNSRFTHHCFSPVLFWDWSFSTHYIHIE